MKNNYYNLMDIISKETNAENLRQQLVACEESVIQQSKYDGILIEPDDETELCRLLETRCDILNRMFAIHATDAELNRFKYVNDRLLQLTHNFNERHLHLQQQISVIQGLNGEPFELRTTLDYRHNPDSPQLYVMEEDSYYKSRWNEMLGINCIMCENSHQNAAFCSGEHICEMDDGKSWNDGALRMPILNHICICYLVHSLCVHLRYSIPDLLRMTTFYYDYNLNCNSDMIKDFL